VPDLAQVTKVLAARAEHYDRTASFPADSIAAIQDAGLLTATVHERYGGQGAGLAQTAAVLRALGQGDPPAALITAMTMFAHALQGTEPTWPDDICTAAVAEAAQRPVLVNALRVKPELGTPARGGLPATVASPDGDRWSLAGHKIFSTGKFRDRLVQMATNADLWVIVIDPAYTSRWAAEHWLRPLQGHHPKRPATTRQRW
jgi:alkylation response protein AidB-like acyl-CoA dehydrogenase